MSLFDGQREGLQLLAFVLEEFRLALEFEPGWYLSSYTSTLLASDPTLPSQDSLYSRHLLTGHSQTQLLTFLPLFLLHPRNGNK